MRRPTASSSRPTAGRAWIPSKKDNIARGRHRDGNDRDFETQTRTVVSQIDLTANAEALDRRIDFDDRDLAQALAFTPAGDAVVVAFQGSNVIEVWDAAARTRLSEVPVGRAPDGLALGPDGRRLYVHNFLDRSVTVLNTAGLLDGTVNEPPVVATVSTVAEEALAPEVLRGKRIFYNAADVRMSQDGYLSCASCHLDGGSDGMVWDRKQFGEGLRNTIDLRGRRGTNGGVVHWSGNFDEIQDFEHDIRDSFGGSGFMADADFRAGTRSDPLGDPKAGVSAELDALAAYTTSLAEVPDSPYRASDGSLTAAGLTGRTVVRDKGCARCHAGADFTDDLIHDVGTVAPSSGQASGTPLAGINTPTLRGLWLSAPYLHNGSLATLAAVLDGSTHMGGALTGEEKSALEAYLLQIDGKESGVTVPISSVGLTANPGNSQVTLSWNTPTNTGGAPIVRYEYRWAESGGEFSDWMRVASAERSATVRELTNGREYMFEVRGVNALGYGPVDDGDGHADGPRRQTAQRRGTPRRRGTTPNGAGRARKSGGGRHRWGGDADVGSAGERRRGGDHGLRVPDRQEEPLDFHRFHRHGPYGHWPRQRHGIRLRGAGGQQNRQELFFHPGRGHAGSAGSVYPGLRAFRQWDRHHLRDGARECGPPSDPARNLLLRSRGPSH